MATTRMQDYELMIIFTPILSDDDFKTAQKKYADMITENGGKIVHNEPWGLKSLAYPIQKKTTGIYWLLEYQAATDFNAKLEIQMNRDENIMRHMVTSLDKHAVSYNERRRNKSKEAPKAKAEAAVDGE